MSSFNDIDYIVERHDSDYINGTKNMFVSGFIFDDDESDADEPEPDDIEVEYVDANGQLWYVYLTASEKAELDAIETYQERLKFLEGLQ